MLVPHGVGEAEGEGDLADLIAGAVVFGLPRGLNNVWRLKKSHKIKEAIIVSGPLMGQKSIFYLKFSSTLN